MKRFANTTQTFLDKRSFQKLLKKPKKFVRMGERSTMGRFFSRRLVIFRDVHGSEVFRTVRSRFEQSNSSDSSNSSNSTNRSDSSNCSDSSDSSDHSRWSKQQNRWLRLTENSKWRVRTQKTTLFNGIRYFGVFKIQNSKWRMPTANKLQKMTWFQWNSVLGGFRGR